MLIIITYIGVFEIWIMLGDFSIFSDTDFIICLMQQIPTLYQSITTMDSDDTTDDSGRNLLH